MLSPILLVAFLSMLFIPSLAQGDSTPSRAAPQPESEPKEITFAIHTECNKYPLVRLEIEEAKRMAEEARSILSQSPSELTSLSTARFKLIFGTKPSEDPAAKTKVLNVLKTFAALREVNSFGSAEIQFYCGDSRWGKIPEVSKETFDVLKRTVGRLGLGRKDLADMRKAGKPLYIDPQGMMFTTESPNCKDPDNIAETYTGNLHRYIPKRVPELRATISLCNNYLDDAHEDPKALISKTIVGVLRDAGPQRVSDILLDELRPYMSPTILHTLLHIPHFARKSTQSVHHHLQGELLAFSTFCSFYFGISLALGC
ncbi:hypothetical protein EJ05DRAFT_139894 [Pseudovirgaria hyperparasitica]|uniref:Uncharacterized protein n=1 Tax=Pseudovirgaria hyperparasitica TaxID=470096 RepID=A0A6A6W003_9PEZI|nr:uncharacterized protein EJ05DRAFT_139894 [Pseudovirgaria hyperparasitica]KAF2754391.1 hypothetical protein EJ05DRAFT_139894 [Pseudovirgaria hyperparasitica]